MRQSPFVRAAVALFRACLLVGLSCAPSPVQSHAQEPPRKGGDWPVLRAALAEVHTSFYPSSEIRPAAMLQGGLGSIAHKYGNVHLEGGVIRLDGGASFSIGDAPDLRELEARAEGALSFLRDHSGVARDELEWAFLFGALRAIDVYSGYYSASQAKSLEEAAAGSIGGVGLVLAKRQDSFVVTEVLPGLEHERSPAFLSGLETGDRIVAVDGQTSERMDDVVTKLRGPVGTTVSLRVARETWPEPRTFELRREKIAVHPIDSMLLSGDVGYVRLRAFDRETSGGLLRALADLGGRAQSGALQGVVLDLRGNPGGLLQTGLQVIDAFLASGTMITVDGLGGREQRAAKRGDAGEALPLVVLVDEGTTSTAELVAGSLQANDRAVLLGRRTFGKGRVQCVHKLPNGGLLRLTCGAQMPADGLAFDGAGIDPDVELVPTGGAPAGPETRTSPPRSRPAYSTAYVDAPGTAFTRIDPQIDLARELLLATPQATRNEVLRGGARMLAAAAAAPSASNVTPVTTTLPRLWTVSVGISKFKDASISLQFANRDAQAVDTQFGSSTADAIPQERRVLLTDEAATRSAILGAISGAAQRAAPDDMVVLFIATHGIPDDRGALYFIAHDTNPRELADTGLRERDIEYAIGNARARRLVLLVDACHSGASGFGALAGGRGFVLAEANHLVGKLAEAKRGIAVLTASSATESSFEASTWGDGHGVFSYYLLRGMKGDADVSKDGVVSIRELYDYTYKNVAADTKDAQHPELKGAFENGMPLAMAAR